MKKLCLMLVILCAASAFAQQVDNAKEARARMAKNDFDGAIAFYTKCLAEDAKKFYCYGERGEAYEKKYKHDLALADYQKAVELSPAITAAALKSNAPKPKYLTKIGGIYVFKADYDKAIESFEKALLIDAEYYDAIVGLGVAWFDKDRQKAASFFTRAMNLKPELPQAYYEVGKLFEILGDEESFKQAYQYYSKAIAADARFAPAYLGRFQVQKYGNPAPEKYQAEQLADISKYIELMPENDRGYYLRGLIYSLEMQKYPEAVKDFTRAIELYPNDAEYFMSRAEAYIALKSHQNAADDITKYLEIAKNLEAFKMIEWLSKRAAAYLALGKKDLAVADLRAVLKIDPGNKETKEALKGLGIQP